MERTTLGYLEIVEAGIPWVIDPKPRRFALPHGDGIFTGWVVLSGTPIDAPGAVLLGSLDTQHVAAALDCDPDVAVVAAKVRYDIRECPPRDPTLQTICSTDDARMKRNGLRLLELIEEAVRSMVEQHNPNLLRALLRHFPLVALRHPRVANLLDSMPNPDDTILRWFGRKAGRGRPARPAPEARTTVATVVHEVDESNDNRSAFERLRKAGLGAPVSLANLRSREGELYELSIGGVLVTADRLQALPWAPPQSARLRWDVYRLPA